MTRHLRTDLERLEKRLLLLGSRVEDAVRESIHAVMECRAELAQQVIAGDEAIDQEEVEIEEDCLKILALHQPVATDLRFATACLKINNDLERIGDLAVNIAKRARAMSQAVPLTPPRKLTRMTEDVTAMLRHSLDAFVRGDSALARRVLLDDERVDEEHRLVFRAMIDEMQARPEVVEPAMLYISTSRALERIADHATNIAEDVVYLVEGEIIRHDPSLGER